MKQQDIILKSITIENFKAFGTPVTIPFKPITMLFGENSAGKSTVLKALVYLREVLKTGLHPEKAKASGGEFDFGSFSDVVHGHNSNETIRLVVEFDFSDKSINDHTSDASRLAHIYNQPIRTGRVQVNIKNGYARTDIWLNGELVLGCDLTDGYVWLESGSPLVREKFLEWDRRGDDDWFTQEELENLIPCYVTGRPFDFDLAGSDYHWETEGPSDNVHQKFYDQGTDYNEIYASAAIPIRLIKRMLSSQLRYIGPLREVPRRNQELDFISKTNWYDGMAAWRNLLELMSGTNKNPFDPIDRAEEVLTEIDKLKLGYTFKIKRLISAELSDSDRPTNDHLLKKETYSIKERLRLVDVSKGIEVQPCEVGTGVSQALPIAVGAFAEGCSLMSVEQPELHLHPRIQCDLGDIFIANMHRHKARKFLIETHSEHLILRLLRRMRETASGKVEEGLELTPDDVAVLAVEAGENGTEIHEMEISEAGELLTPWPNGFFPERMTEILGG